ncbi:hypothetical protein PR002_g31153 [Phytophthora rubi]|uniref:Uncharacterized protein n=1 Tax=Phytophthora rubi TaxID=129364 RepID=A0A6A3GM35_9STRA|nr:hypothetical protein PR002_g31153 [Phytophthora rubi]
MNQEPNWPVRTTERIPPPVVECWLRRNVKRIRQSMVILSNKMQLLEVTIYCLFNIQQTTIDSKVKPQQRWTPWKNAFSESEVRRPKLRVWGW